MSLEDDNVASGSDSEDEDYVPTGGNEALSEDESGNESHSAACSGGDEDEETNGQKRKKNLKKNNRTRKKMKLVEEKENEEEKPIEEISFEEKRKRASSLWEDFMNDVGGSVIKNKVEEPSAAKTVDKVSKDNCHETTSSSQQPAKTKVTEIFEFAGEKVEVEREVPATQSSKLAATKSSCHSRPSSGISGLLGQLGKKGKLSTLEKSKLDWDKFKKQEGIDEELGTFNKGKNGFLEKQDFLQRTDLRQFEIEKEMRNHRRNLNR